jgi:serine/threonine-protein kinase
MAPEIIDGEEADARSDIFSLGTVLYWLVTGSLPFEASSPGALLKKVLEGDFTDPRTLKPDVSDGLAKVIADSLARDRNQRIASAVELQQRLQTVLTESGLERPNELLTRFLKHPAETTRETREHVVGVLMTVGAEAAKAGKVGKALSTYGRVIAIAPGTPEAGAARDAIDRMKSRVRWRKRGIAAAVLACIGAVLLVVKPYRFLKSAPQPTPIAVVATTPKPLPEATAPRDNNPPGLDVQNGTPPEKTPSPTATREPKTPVSSPPPRDVVAAVAKPSPPPVVEVPLFVKSKPWGRIYIDRSEKPVGVSDPQLKVPLPAGPHHIEIRQECCETFVTDVVLVPGQSSKIDVELQMEAKVQFRSVRGPPDVVVRVNNGIRGTFQDVEGKVIRFHNFPEGQSKLQIAIVLSRPPSNQKQEQMIALSAGETKPIDLEWTVAP